MHVTFSFRRLSRHPSRAVRSVAVAVLLALAGGVRSSATEIVRLETLDLSKLRQSWGQPQINRSMRERPLVIAGKSFEHGVGTHAHSTLWLELAGGTERFQAAVGLDEAAAGPGSVEFLMYADGNKRWSSGVMKPGDAAKAVDVDLRGVRTFLLRVTDGGEGISYDHANWADARFVVNGARPVVIDAPREEAVILTPKPGPAPRINGPTVHGCRPGNPFLYRMPTTGDRPMKFTVDGLPEGLQLDAESGIISGTTPARGEYRVTLRALNKLGADERGFRIVSGDRLALTPPMGWNHWYTHYDRITDQLMREAADAMVRSGMADVGYQYVSIDDCWMNTPKSDDPLRVGPLRDDHGNLLPNRHFPDLRALTEHIHAHGLKAGIYTSPGPLTCAGYSGSYQHEAQDARQFADWGFDSVKYDWCSYGDIVRGDNRVDALQKPYRVMGELLRRQPRDMLLNLCQYGMGNVWEWGAEVGGHSWRTAGDLGFELDRVFEVALKNAEHRAWSKPGEWNDPDYIQIGYIGSARGMGEPRPCPLTPTEQYAFMSLWSLMAAPLFFSGDMNRLDEFTLNVLCNPEVIAVNQDPLGQCARVVMLSEETFLMVKELADGSRALGLGNRGEFETEISVAWSDVGLEGPQVVRDLWRQRDIAVRSDRHASMVPRHGVVLVQMSPAVLPGRR
jgi:alpha-galactosidase